MRNALAVLITLIFVLSTAVASPFDEGGGTPDENESNLATILMVTAVAGFAALLIGDILSDNSTDSQDALAGIPDSTTVHESTGIDWGSFSSETADNGLPVVAVAVFQGDTGRDLARYLTGLLVPGEDIYYSLYGSPVSLGNMSSSQAAETGFSFINCDMFIAGDDSGFQLFYRDNPDPVWSLEAVNPDSNAVRRASASLLDFISNR